MPNSSTRRCFACLPIVIALVSPIVGCAGGEERVEGGKPNLLLITLDTTRADYFSCYGYPRVTTPNFDALAADGCRQVLAAQSRALAAAQSQGARAAVSRDLRRASAPFDPATHVEGPDDGGEQPRQRVHGRWADLVLHATP